jgi:purine-cytosine permease-like protein
LSQPQGSHTAHPDPIVDAGHDTYAVEHHGVDTIPDVERTARPRDVLTILWGGNLALSVIVFGWLAILAGLSWWAAVSAIVVGVFVGSLAVLPLSLLGFRSGTNNSVSSGAYFGVRGRLIASGIGLLLTLGYLALTVWTGGEATAASVSRLLGDRPTNFWYAAGYAVIAILIAVVAIYGFGWLVVLNKAIVPVVGITMVLTVIAFASQFDASYPGTPDQYALGSFWPTWLLVALTAGVSGPISYVTMLGDWTRYVSPQRHNRRSVLTATWLGLFVGLLVPTLFGAFISVVAFDSDSMVAGLIKAAPGWLIVPVLATGIVGSLGQGGLNLYSMGLDLDAILPRLTRLQSTVVVAAVATGLVFLGKFVWDAETSVTTFVLVLTSLATPWAVITIIGMRRSGGQFDEHSLQVFNRRERGGAYWFSAGWNIDATLAWIAGSIVGLMSNSTVSFVGPIANRLGGLDTSILTSSLTAGLIYLALVTLRPHRHAARSSSNAS